MDVKANSISQRKKVVEEFEEATRLLYIVGSLSMIGAGQLLLIPAGLIVSLIIVLLIPDYSLQLQFQETIGFLSIAIVMILLTTVGLLLLRALFPDRMAGLCDAILVVSGILLLVTPILPLGGYVAQGGAHGTVFAFQLDYWFVFPVIGMGGLALREAMTKHYSSPLSDSLSSLLWIMLGLLCIIFYGYSVQSWPSIDSSGEDYPTPFSLLAMSVGVFIMSTAIVKVASNARKSQIRKL